MGWVAGCEAQGGGWREGECLAEGCGVTLPCMPGRGPQQEAGGGDVGGGGWVGERSGGDGDRRGGRAGGWVRAPAVLSAGRPAGPGSCLLAPCWLMSTAWLLYLPCSADGPGDGVAQVRSGGSRPGGRRWRHGWVAGGGLLVLAGLPLLLVQLLLLPLLLLLLRQRRHQAPRAAQAIR